MYYYLVAVRSGNQVVNEQLTYASESVCSLGDVVTVPLRNGKGLGYICAEVTQQPTFRVKPITTVHAGWQLTDAQRTLADWLHSYYPAAWSQHAKLHLPSTIKKKPAPPATEFDAPLTAGLPPLTKNQIARLHDITNSEGALHWLHGDTGSGKTRMYTELALEAIAQGKDVLVLVPEIGLSGQLVKVLKQVFGNRVYNYHSALSEGPRADVWQHIAQANQPIVVVAPRSGLFLPFRQLGLIVVDEAHDSAYKQDQQPRYQTLPVAAKLAALHGARCIFGSATPNVSDLWLTTHKAVPTHRLQGSAIVSAHQTTVTIADQTDRTLYGRNRVFSDPALEAIETSMRDGEQSLVYLNRRGTARLISCNNCGWQAMCPQCDLVLTYHHDTHQLRCHTCGYTTSMMTSCPQCTNTDIVLKAHGTKAITAQLEQLFPTARISRFDTDNLASERLERHISALQGGDVDIVVGTQMITKGLDLPNLSSVIVVQADVGLSLPDYRGEEKAFQQLLQVMGRVGRGHRGGRVIIQTHQAEHPILKAAASSNWDAFYRYEITNRKTFGFPPFCYLAKLWVERASAKSAATAATTLAKRISSAYTDIQILGPTPAYYEKGPHGYRWQIMLKSASRSRLLGIIAQLPANWQYDVDPDNSL